MNKIFFSRLQKNVKIPSKRIEDGCYDVYANFELDHYEIPPHEVVLIPTGIVSAFDSKYRIGFRERGSNTKSVLIVMAGQIDSGYRGEWFVALYNGNNKTVYLTKDVEEVVHKKDRIEVPYSKAICQAALEEVPQDIEFNEIPYKELLEMKSERMLGKLGASEK